MQTNFKLPEFHKKDYDLGSDPMGLKEPNFAYSNGYQGQETADGERASSAQCDIALAYERGQNEGQAAAHHTYEQTIAVMENSLAALKAQLFELCAEQTTQYQSQFIDILRDVFPHLINAETIAALEGFVANIFGGYQMPKLRCFVSDVEAEQALVQIVGEDRALDIIISDKLSKGEIRFAWRGGGAEFNPEQTKHALFQALGIPNPSVKNKG